ncbi:GNAT family N-acetyltransferase [Streptomyces sp. t39]|uniref:GNAT family N-acetyltransferase n=1 Tax=Streptomyces sp. t39 TaxID=1828156 RepID=UPI0011CE59A3|nr:GNAT family N-acetyltransferase [Streptomyces sp. t39]TXS56755.1 GNAT family N-acetyltransferase [Streptomyces sp. t39]
MEFTVAARLEVRVTPADVGKRVSVRAAVPSGAPGSKFTDTVGVLTSWTGGVLLITRRTGEIVRIPETSLVAGKEVPAEPARRRGPSAGFAELARVTARAWQPVESERLGDWELRAAGGFTRRANSVLPLGDPGMPLDEALSRVRGWYAERGLPAYVQVATGAAGTQEELGAALAGRGWRREVSAEVWTGGLAPVADLAVDDARVRVERALGDTWTRRYQRFSEPGPQVRAVLTAGPSVSFATVPAPSQDPDAAAGPAPGAPEEAPAAIGRCVVDGRWAGFMAVEVDPAHRRQGLATAVMAALARRALDEGASAAWLQVESDNAPARELYTRMGFAVHHHYHHFRAV